MKGIPVMTFIDCKCHKPDKVKYVDGKYFCSRCGEPIIQLMGDGNRPLVHRRKYSVTVTKIDIGLLGERVEQIESMGRRVDELETAIVCRDETIRQLLLNCKSKDDECARLREKIDGIKKSTEEEIRERTSVLRRVNGSLCEKLDRRNKQVSGLAEELDSFELRLRKIESDLVAKEKQLSNYEATIDKQTKIIRNFRNDSEALKSKISELESENRSLSESTAHYRNEAEAACRIPVRDMTGRLLEYMTSMYNIALDRCPQDVRDMIMARTEYFAMNLGNLGVDVSFHKRGDELGNGRADVRTHTTDVPEEDCRVFRTDRFGCSFVDGIFADIPEAITVNRFVPPPESAAESSGVPETETEVTVADAYPKAMRYPKPRIPR